MYEQNLISVVIPTKNRAKLLPRALESARGQTYQNLEILVVSDGSQDETDEIMAQKEAQGENIRYLSYFPGRGGNYARNMGIRAARGEWVAFLDDDDEWHPDKLQKQMQLAQSNPGIGLICTAINVVEDATGAHHVHCPEVPDDPAREILKRNFIGSTTTVLVRHSLLDECGMFDEEMPAKQDYDLWIRLCRLTGVGVVEYHNLAENNQISWDYRRYAAANARLWEKYGKDRRERLTPAEVRNIRAEEQMSLARKAFKAGQRDKTRAFAREALKYRFSGEGAAYLLASRLPARLVRRVYGKLRG